MKLRRRIAALCISAAMLLTLAPAVLADGAGNCVTNQSNAHELAGKGSYDYNSTSGVKAYIDPANTGNDDLCRNPGLILNNGVTHTVQLGVIDFVGGSQDIPRLASLGVSDCDSPTPGSICERNVWHYFIQMVDCNGSATDATFDLGKTFRPSPWGGHSYQINYDYATLNYNFYIDGYLAKTINLNSAVIYFGHSYDFTCYRPSTHDIRAIWQSEREDLGDAWSSSAGVPASTTDWQGMLQYQGGGNWVLPPNQSCDFNTRQVTPHRQYCSSSLGRSYMTTYTIY